MDFKQIQELVKLVNKSNIGELSVEEGDFKITIKQKEEKTETVYASMPMQQMMPQMQSMPAMQELPGQSGQSTPEAKAKADNLLTIKSPMIGTFYRKASPDKPSFIEVGDEVSVGSVVCIIEAMKLFNEIESEISGRVVKVIAEDASPVEFDQPLFLVEPL
ncbi:MAG: acetyl-CoA carboxylase biotin carboxyl carrier protein [Chitinophagaceae bacterium]